MLFKTRGKFSEVLFYNSSIEISFAVTFCRLLHYTNRQSTYMYRVRVTEEDFINETVDLVGKTGSKRFANFDETDLDKIESFKDVKATN